MKYTLRALRHTDVTDYVFWSLSLGFENATARALLSHDDHSGKNSQEPFLKTSISIITDLVPKEQASPFTAFSFS